MKPYCILGILFAVSVLCAGYWDAPDKLEKLNAQTPGQRLLDLDPDVLMKTAALEAMSRWKGPLTDEAFAALAEQREPRYGIGTDAEIGAQIPSSISPYARIRGVPFPAIRPFLHWTGHFTRDQLDSYYGLISYCPFCSSNALSVRFDPANASRAVLSCCKKVLYRDGWPEEYGLKPDSTARFRYLDDSIREIPCTLYRDTQGRTWELFIGNLFNMRDWMDARRIILYRLMTPYLRDGNPFYPYKAAVYLDHLKDLYYALPLSLNNLIAPGRDGMGLTRREWEALPRPNRWAQMPEIGWWNRAVPTFARGWMNLAGDAGPAVVFAMMRHHPAFRYYSKRKYGDPDRLEKEIVRMFLKEVNLGFSSVNMHGLMVNYQQTNYTGITVSALLGRDRELLGFAAPNHELSFYNHHYSDGLNGEGSTGYQGMLRRQFYPVILEKHGWGLIDPGFLRANPFVRKAAGESGRQITARGMLFEHGDCYELLRELPGDRVNLNLQKNGENGENERLPSHVWSSWGVGVIRVGGPGQRLETVLNFSRPHGHGDLMMGLASWFDGICVIRPGGYAPPWSNLDAGGVKELNLLNLPRKAVTVPPERPNVHETWNRLLAKTAMNQSSLTVNEISSVRRGISEVLAFKGGEPYGSPESGFQVLEVGTIGEFQAFGVRDVTKYRRALIGVETPSGKAYVLDFLPVAGGKSQTLWYSVWGERTAEKLPADRAGFATMTDALFGGTLPPPSALFPPLYHKWIYRSYDHIVKVRRSVETEEPWSADFRTDYYAYWRDGNGTPEGRPAPGFGIVDFRISGIPAGGPVELLSAKAPWSAVVRLQKTRSGGMIDQKTAVFEDGFDLLAQRREAKNGMPLESCFVTLLEGRHPGAAPVVAGASALSIRKSSGQARAVRLVLTGGGTDVVIYQEATAPLVLADGTETDARYALIRRDAEGRVRRLDMFCGSYLRTGGRELRGVAEESGILDDLNADLTGDRTASVLYIRPDRPWDTASAAGKELLLRIRRTDGLENNEGFRIESAGSLPDGRVMVKLEGPAPLIAGWHQGFFFGDGRTDRLRLNRPIQKFSDIGWYPGTKALFPKTGKTFIVKETQYGEIVFKSGTDLKREGIRDGDWFILYAIEPGQRVVLPRSFRKEFLPDQAAGHRN